MLLLFTIFLFIPQSDQKDTYIFSDNSLFLNPYLTHNFQRENYIFVGDNSLLANGPIIKSGQILGMIEENDRRDHLLSYKVKSGDTLSTVADRFGISENTIRWANDISDDYLKKGEELLILPTTGVLYYVEKGDTPSSIAALHNADVEKLMRFNKIEDSSNLKPGDKLIIPGGEKPTISSSSYTNYNYSFINPVPGGTVTQGLHFYNAIDIHQSCGSPVVASANGKVISIGIGTWPAGNFVKIDHNGIIFLYGHLQNIYVENGDYVSQGQQIGTVGNTGHTIGVTGCHLHFDALTTKINNPFYGVPLGRTP